MACHGPIAVAYHLDHHHPLVQPYPVSTYVDYLQARAHGLIERWTAVRYITEWRAEQSFWLLLTRRRRHGSDRTRNRVRPIKHISKGAYGLVAIFPGISLSFYLTETAFDWSFWTTNKIAIVVHHPVEFATKSRSTLWLICVWQWLIEGCIDLDLAWVSRQIKR